MKRTLTGAIVVNSLLCILLNVTTTCGQGSAPRNDQAQTLTTKQPITRAVKGGESHDYQIELTTNQYLRAEVEQKGIEVVVSIFDPDGKLVVEMDGDTSYLWRESVSAVGAKAGRYKLQITVKGAVTEAGSFTARIAELRDSVALDRKRIEAEQTLIRAIKSNRQEDAKESARLYEAAASLWREVGDKYWAAVTLWNLAYVYHSSDQNNRALDSLTEALGLFREVRDRIGEVKALTGIGYFYKEAQNYELARDYLEQSLAIKRSLKQPRGEFHTLHALIAVYLNLGKRDRLLKSLNRMLEVSKELHDPELQVTTLSEWGDFYQESKDYAKAAGFYERALRTHYALEANLRTNEGEFNILSKLYFAYKNSNRLDKMIQTLESMLPVSKKLTNREMEAYVLEELGLYYYARAVNGNQGERDANFHRAIDYCAGAHSIYEELKSDNALRGKITCLRYMGSSYSELRENEKAIPYFQLSLDLLPELERGCPTCDVKAARAILYGDLGFALFFEGREEEALRYLIQVDYENLGYWKDKKELLKRSLDILDALLISLGDVVEYEYTIKTYEQIVKKIKSDKDYGYNDADLKGLYISLGNVYMGAGYYDSAKTSYDMSLLLSLKVQRERNKSKKDLDKLLMEDAVSTESTALNNIGIIFLRNGYFDEALRHVQQALDIASRQKDPLNITKYRSNIAGVYARQKNYDSAIKIFDEVIPQLKKMLGEYAAKFSSTKDVNARLQEKNLAAFVGIDLYYYGAVLRETGNLQGAISYHQESIQTLHQYKYRKFEARARVELGLDYIALNNPELAVEEFKSAYLLSTAAQARDEQAASLDGLMRASESLKSTSLAIVYGKRSVNLLQKTRAELERLGESVASEFVKDNENIYRRLANLLISEDRLLEARIILDLLKEEEYKSATRSLAIETVPYSKAEDEIIDKIENLVSLERDLRELDKIQKETGALSVEQQAKRAGLSSKIEAADKDFKDTLTALGNTFRSSQIRMDELRNGKELKDALTYLRGKTESGVVALYTVLGTEETKDPNDSTKTKMTKFGWVVMITSRDYKAYPIDVETLEQYVQRFVIQLASEHSDPKLSQASAEKIYTAIFRQTSDKQQRTLEQDLRDYLAPYPDKTIMWSLDGVLRYIPMAALHDGKQYLVENYRNVLFTKNSFVSLVDENREKWNVLGVGVSEPREKSDPPLPRVKTELEAIINEPNKRGGILSGKIELNDNFQKQRFFDEVSSGKFTVAHVASHYHFNAMKVDESFLLTGDGRLTVSELKGKKNLFGALDLLTLSACETGAPGTGNGNGKEAEGFSYLAQSLGAKSVIASLWKVSDADASEFMIQFYKLRADKPQMTKGEAFRQAQLSLLHANSNPHYWASFVLMGNWR